MKVTPSNQTLILAGEREPLNARYHPPLNNVPADAVLQRLTIVAARPDATLWYVQADYQPSQSASKDPTANGGRGIPALRGDALPAPPPSDPAELPRTVTTAPSAIAAANAYATPLAVEAPAPARATARGLAQGIGLYTRTQNILTDMAAPMHIDVHA